MIRLARILTCTVALLLASCGVVGAQTNGQSGPYSSQIQVALRNFLTLNNTFSGTQTFSSPVLLPDGTVAAPALAFASSTDMGVAKVALGRIGIVSGGSWRQVIDGAGTVIPADSYFGFAATVGDASGSVDLKLFRDAAATLRLGANAAGVTDQMLKGPDRITSDGVGGSLYIAGGRNRGASAGGSLIFQTSPVAGAGVTGTLATRLTIDSVGTANFTGTIATGGSGMAVANVGANSCGSTAATIAGNSNAFVITVGTVAGTQCRVAFPIAASTEWDCVANDSTTTTAVRTTPYDTTHTDILGAFVAADKVTGHCFPR